MPLKRAAAARWRAVTDDFHQSGFKQAELCRLRGLSPHTFRRYVYGSQVDAHDHPPARFLPVTPLTDPSDGDHADRTADTLVLILDGGRRLAVTQGSAPRYMHGERDGRYRPPVRFISQQWPVTRPRLRRSGACGSDEQNSVPRLKPAGDLPGLQTAVRRFDFTRLSSLPGNRSRRDVDLLRAKTLACLEMPLRRNVALFEVAHLARLIGKRKHALTGEIPNECRLVSYPCADDPRGFIKARADHGRCYPMFGVKSPGRAAPKRENALFSRTFSRNSPRQPEKCSDNLTRVFPRIAQ
jgi:hypothetical protein